MPVCKSYIYYVPFDLHSRIFHTVCAHESFNSHHKHLILK